MTVVIPQPVPLEMPPEDPGALEDFAADVAGTGYRLAVVSTCLTTAPSEAPHWQGADAAAAAAQVGVVAALADELSGRVAAAAHRLRAHHDRLLEVRRRIATLRSQQDDDFTGAWGRLSRIQDYRLVAMGDGPEAVAVVEDLQAAEAARRREHARLLEELADDAAVTTRALGDACRPLGGTGRRGENGVVTAFLAAELPGWGEAELRRRGTDLAAALTGLLPAEERDAIAREAFAFAGSAAFAGAFLAGLGVHGVGELLSLLGDGDLGPTSALARTLAHALGVAVPAGWGGEVDDVLTATYLDPEDDSTGLDLIALGMGVVISAGGAAGPRAETVLRWGRQMLDRERRQGEGLIGSRAVDRAAPIGQAFVPADPMAAVLRRLTRSEDATTAAAFLEDRPAWDVLLSRPWDDGGIGFARLIDHAGTAAGPVGGTAARAGLEALGAGLEDGDPDGWSVDRDTAAVISEALGRAVSSHVSLVAGALERAADGQAGPRDGDALRGLGYLTLDSEAVRLVDESLHRWVRDDTDTPDTPGAPGAAQLAAVPAGFVAVREYGQRLAYALHGFEQQAAAELRESRYDASWGLLPNLARRTGVGLGAGLVSDFAKIAFDADGTWDNGADDGAVYDARDAQLAAQRSLGGSSPAVGDVSARAADAFENTVDVLGRPEPPASPPTDWAEPFENAAWGFGLDKATDGALRRVGEALDGPPPTLHTVPHD